MLGHIIFKFKNNFYEFISLLIRISIEFNFYLKKLNSHDDVDLYYNIYFYLYELIIYQIKRSDAEKQKNSH